MRILITGANGQLGSEFRALASHHSAEFIFCDVDEMDLSQESSMEQFLANTRSDLIIHCGAYTQVDGAEDQKELAFAINANAPAVIARHCANTGCRLIQVSTDYVFDGNGNMPISEEDRPNAQSVYGASKLEGEKQILSILDNAYIIRTSWVYSAYGKNFVKTMLRLGQERDELNVVVDQAGTPTYAADLAAAILKIVDQWPGNDRPGIYHYSNWGVLSWYDFAKTIFDLAGVKCHVNPIPSSGFPVKAQRPAFSVLDKTKIASTFHLDIPYWRDSLERCLEEIRKLK